MRLLLLAFALSSAAAAAGPASAAALTVPIDQSTRLGVSGTAASVLVGNPSVADVTVVDSHTLYVSGRGYGATDVVVLDRSGRALYTGDIVVTAPEGGRVSVYRGAARTDLACAPGCQVSVRSGGGSVGGSSAPSAGGGSSAGAGLPSVTAALAPPAGSPNP